MSPRIFLPVTIEALAANKTMPIRQMPLKKAKIWPDAKIYFPFPSYATGRKSYYFRGFFKLITWKKTYQINKKSLKTHKNLVKTPKSWKFWKFVNMMFRVANTTARTMEFSSVHTSIFTVILIIILCKRHSYILLEVDNSYCCFVIKYY